MIPLRHPMVAALCAALAVPAGFATPAAAQTPRDLQDLVGARGGQAERALTNRGYSWARTDKSNDASYAYWRRGDDCVLIVTRDGRYQSITSASERQCRGGGSSGGSNAAAAAVAGVAIIGLAAALAAHNNKKKDHDRDDRHDDDYSRGYQDGLNGARYDRDDSEGYHDGFLAGQAEADNRRAADTRWAQNAPRAARQACAARGDDYLNLPRGSAVAVSTSTAGAGRYEITVASGHYRARCLVTAEGRVIEMNPF